MDREVLWGKFAVCDFDKFIHTYAHTSHLSVKRELDLRLCSSNKNKHLTKRPKGPFHGKNIDMQYKIKILFHLVWQRYPVSQPAQEQHLDST